MAIPRSPATRATAVDSSAVSAIPVPVAVKSAAVISGGAGNETLYGTPSADTISGGGGNDRLLGGAGNDILDGGSGSDNVNGEAGDDTAIFMLGENARARDAYDGGSGRDVLRLDMTRAEWMSAAVQNDITAYLAFLASDVNASTGESRGGRYQFSFGLTATKFESLQVTVDGVAVDPRDRPVSLVNDTIAAGEDTPSIAINVLANDSVPNLVASLTYTQAAHGSLTLTRTNATTTSPDTASFVYTPDATHWQYLASGETATDSFTYTVRDADGDTQTATVTVTITGANDAPVAAGESTTVSEDGSVTLTAAVLVSNDTDVDGDTLSVASVDGTDTLGTVQLVDGDVVYTAGSAFQYLQAGETATDSFTYTVRDPSGATSTATVNVLVNGANDGPTAGDDSAFVAEGGSVIIPVLTNDSDPEGDALTITGVSAATNGVAVINPDGTVSYTPNAGFSGGSDSFTYTVRDALGVTATASVSVVVGLSDHDEIIGDVFLQGNYMEIGISASGSLGTATAAPANYHPQGMTNISYVVDTDGWTFGDPPRAGDFTLPGAPVDTIVVAFNGASYVQDERSGVRQIETTTTDISTSTLLGARTMGLIGGSLRFTQTITLDPSATYYITTITVENISAATMNDVRFMRSFDPDQDVTQYGTYNTNNDVLSNPTAGNDLAIAQALGVGSGVSVNLVAFDADARASNFGFANYDAYTGEAYAGPIDLNGASVDQAITLTFNFGNLAAGQSATKVFYTTLNGSAGANDMLLGTNGADLLNSGAGNDILIGLGGADQLTGGVGNDRFIFSTGSGADRIMDFTAGAGTDDVIELRGFGIADMIDLRAHAAQVGVDVVIDLGDGDTITLSNVALANLSADDFWFIGQGFGPGARAGTEHWRRPTAPTTVGYRRDQPVGDSP